MKPSYLLANPWSFCAIAAAFLLSGCGVFESYPTGETNTAAERVAITVKIQAGTFSPESLSFQVDSCKSGFSESFQTTGSEQLIYLYRYDSQCKISISSFVWKTKTWVPASGVAYVGPAPAIFEHTSEQVQVRLQTSLPETLTGSATVSFAIQEIQGGSATSLISISPPVAKPSLVFDAPALHIYAQNGVTLTGWDASMVPTFQFLLECSTIVAEGICPTTPNAQNQALTSLEAKLTNDTEGGTCTYTSAAEATASGTTPILSAWIQPSSSPYLGGLAFSLAASSPLTAGKNFRLLLKYAATPAEESSYTCLDFDWGVPPNLMLRQIP